MNRTLILVCTLALSCGETVKPRSTVQADAIAKTDLAGTWYFRQTVVGTPFTTGFTFVGEQGENEMEKITWDIQEGMLTARRAYEFVRGTEKNGPHQQSVGGGYLGAPVASFKITSHFDIIREYNSSTGEEYDKVVESQERKWFDRRFIRVDWSTNLVSNFNFLADYSTGSVAAIKTDPVPYYVNDPKDPDAFRIERPFTDQPASYIEMTTKMVASPEAVSFEDGTSWPLCFMEYTVADCASQELRVRSAFMRAEKRDYEPLVYDDKMMERFGYFTVERKSYNRDYGVTEAGRVRLINRHNLWRKSLGDTVCTKASDCGAPAAGVRCVTETPDAKIDSKTGVVSGVCSLPWAQRNLDASGADLGPKQIIFHVNDSFPADLKDTAVALKKQYDAIYRGILKDLTGRDSPYDVFTVCLNNPVLSTDPAECGAPGTHPRIGDIRYNLLYWVDEPTSAGLLGYGPNSNDPETGEVISSSAFVYGAQIDEYAAYARDLVRLVNGEIAPDKFIDGVNVREWINSSTFGAKSRTHSQGEVDEMSGRMDTSWTKGLPRHPSMKKGTAKSMRALLTERHQALKASPVLKGSPGMTARRLAKLHGSDVEAQLVDGEALFMRGINPKTPGIGVLAPSQVRPLELFNPAARNFRKKQRAHLASKGVDFATIDDTVLGFALAQKGADPRVVWKKIREQVFLSTALHEVGHTVGLRHNFAGSYDALNYPKQYWDLRTSNGTKVPKPRHLEAETKAELEGLLLPTGLRAGISEFQSSSIMDYGANFNSDIQGLGKYDIAALKFGYGQLVEVFTDVKNPYLMGALQASVSYGSALPILTNCAGNDFIVSHYTKLPTLVSMESRANVPFSSLKREILAPTCAYPDNVEVDAQKRMVVPYQFCSDEFEAASTGCEAFDRGADPFEVASSAMNTYRNYYLFDAFRRERLGFNPDWYLDRLYGRYLGTLRTMMQFYVLDKAYYDGSVSPAFWTSPDGYGPYTVAVTQSFDFLGEMLMMPEPGKYYVYSGDDNRDAWYHDDSGTGAPGFTLGLGQSRYFNTQWEYDSGYFWYERVRNVGSFVDKVAALSELTDPETYFIGKDVAADLREFSINYWRIYPRQMLDLYGATLTDRWDRLAPVFNGTTYKHRPISATITIPPAGTLPVDPAMGFTVQLWMASLGSALIPATFDPTFTDSARLWLAGNGAQVSSTLPTVTFADPYSGKTYTAISYLSGILETGIAARMISRANELKGLLNPQEPSTAAALKSYLQLLEAQRSISEVYSNPVQ